MTVPGANGVSGEEMFAPCARNSGLRNNAVGLRNELTAGKSLCACLTTNGKYLDIPGALAGLVGHLLLDAGQLLLQVGRLVLVQVRQVMELVFQPLVPL